MWIVMEGGCQGIFHAISEEDLQRILVHPATMIASDGEIPTFGQAVPHPRSYGTFVRVLGLYVRDKKLLTLETAVQKMSSFPAQRLGLADRGVLRTGLKADLAIFDPARVADTATFEKPHSYADGVSTVIVNGADRLREGGDDPGASGTRALRPGDRGEAVDSRLSNAKNCQECQNCQESLLREWSDLKFRSTAQTWLFVLLAFLPFLAFLAFDEPVFAPRRCPAARHPHRRPMDR